MKSLSLIVIAIFAATRYPAQSFEKGTKVFYVGSAASSRYFDLNFFHDKTEEYYKSPIVSMGLDYCFSSIRDISNSRLGIGPYFSCWTAKHTYTDDKNNRWDNQWTDFLAAIRFTHHLTYFVRKKLDMCSGVVIGARYKHYHYIAKERAGIPNDYRKQQLYPAIGITASMRYYFYKNIGFFGEFSLGYKTDMYLFGLAYKFQAAN